MPHDLGFAAPASRRDLAALRAALGSIQAGARATATFRTADHGRFTVSGAVRRDLTDTAYKVGWWDLTTGKAIDPVAELQSLTLTDDDTDARSALVVTEVGDLHGVTSTLESGDIVTADFQFEGCGTFTISGEVRRDDSGLRWIVAGHHVAYGDVPAPRLRSLVIERKAAAPSAVAGDYDVFGD